eukprot:2380419-Amphidinium_carterae.1
MHFEGVMQGVLLANSLAALPAPGTYGLCQNTSLAAPCHNVKNVPTHHSSAMNSQCQIHRIACCQEP